MRRRESLSSERGKEGKRRRGNGRARGRTLTAAVLLAEVGEPPDVAEADAESQDGEEELQRRAPLRALVVLGRGGAAAVAEI